MTRHYSGGCYCGTIAVAFESALEPAAIRPRACDCEFCRKHGAAWVSDPRGRLQIRIADRERVSWFRQGSETAQFLVCGRCGVLVAVVHDAGDGRHAAVNARALADRDALGPETTVSPRSLAPAERTARWSQVWFADVELA